MEAAREAVIERIEAYEGKDTIRYHHTHTLSIRHRL